MGDDSRSWVGIVPVVLGDDHKEGTHLSQHAKSGQRIFGRKRLQAPACAPALFKCSAVLQAGIVQTAGSIKHLIVIASSQNCRA